MKRKMTPRQDRVLRSALELGYYDYPKKISTGGLAEVLKIKSSTVSEILRRAEKYAISSYYTTTDRQINAAF